MRGFTPFLLSVIFLLILQPSFALEQNEMLWLAVNTQRPITANRQWLGLFYSQLRFNNAAHPWRSGIIEGGIGYQLVEDKSLWLGYRWTGINPYHGFYQENRLFQQIVLKYLHTKIRYIAFRSRFEETQRTNQAQIALRFRQRFTFEFHHLLSAQVFPLIYEELFFPLNKTDYTSHSFVSQNRLFLGANIRQSKFTYWEVGYINQYVVHTPSNSQNQMNHIFSVTYSFS